jgi:hypothetical protein
MKADPGMRLIQNLIDKKLTDRRRCMGERQPAKMQGWILATDCSGGEFGSLGRAIRSVLSE